MKTIFVSYAHPDLEKVRSLVAFLRAAKLDVWFDKDQLLGGQDWEKVITRQIKECALFLVNLSSKALDRKGFFHKEIRLALDVALTIPPAQLYIMPVKLDGCAIPDDLVRYHVLDLFTENGPEMLLRSIGFAFKEPLTSTPDSQQCLLDAIGNWASTPAKVTLKGHSVVDWEPFPAAAEQKKRLSRAAAALLDEMVADDRSATHGVSFMLLSQTQGFYVPYLWDNVKHGALSVPIIDIATTRVATEELVQKGFLHSLPQSGQLKQYVLKQGWKVDRSAREEHRTKT